MFEGYVMKLNQVRPTVETSGELEEQFFSIEDQGMIFDILRNKMYSNPILAICREITSNARDAHREVKQTAPVEITLPNHLEEYYKVKDFGPGISPDRMTNIFIKYTASTKRGDNSQTGGFGLGAKTPFAYSDSFSVITVVDGIKYDYSCFIDETRVGKMVLLHQGPTNEPNGTEIVIPVKSADYGNFVTYTERACRHWDVKPKIKNGTITWNTLHKIVEGNRWAIAKSENYSGREVRMIIDGIEYPLDMAALKTYNSGKLVDAARGIFVMYWGVGELSLSASREAIYLDKPTQNRIDQRLDAIAKEIKDQVDKKIDAFPDLWKANLYYRKELNESFNNINFLGELAWKGIKLTDHYLHVSCPAFAYTKGKYSRKHGTDPNKISRSSMTSIYFEEDCDLYINDLPLKEPTPRHVKKAFDSNPNLKKIQLLCPTDKITVAEMARLWNIDKMGPKLLSTITSASARNYTPATSRLLIFQFDAGSSAFRQSSYQTFDDDDSEKVICLLSKENVTYSTSQRVARLTNGQKVGLDAIRTLLRKFTGVTLYGIDLDTPKDRVKEDFGDIMTLDEFIEQNVVQNKTIDYVKIKHATMRSTDSRLVDHLNKFIVSVKDPNSLFLKRAEAHKAIHTLKKVDTGLLHLYESMKAHITDVQITEFLKYNPDLDIDKLDEQYEERYPLLPVVRESYQFERIIPHIAEYVNLVDKEKSNE